MLRKRVAAVTARGSVSSSNSSAAEKFIHDSMLEISEITDDYIFNKVLEGTKHLGESSSKSEDNNFIQKKKKK